MLDFYDHPVTEIMQETAEGEMMTQKEKKELKERQDGMCKKFTASTSIRY